MGHPAPVATQRSGYSNDTPPPKQNRLGWGTRLVVTPTVRLYERKSPLKAKKGP